MKILLTGGSGFIGRSLRVSLGATHEVSAPTRQELDVTTTNAVDEVFRTKQYDAVIHAAVAGGDGMTDNILRGFWNIARNAGRVGRILYFGSGAEYGKHQDLIKVREEEIGREVPRDRYGFAKLICNDIARRSKNITNLRLFGVYGPYEGYLFKFISNTVAKSLLGLPVDIRQNVAFDYLWIDDLSAVLRRILDFPTHVTDINITPTESITLLDIAKIIETFGDSPLRIQIETPGMNYQYTGSNEALRALIPDLRFTAYHSAIRCLFDYHAARIDTLDRGLLTEDEYRRSCRIRR